MLRGVHAGTPRRDSRVGGDARHLGEHQPRPALRPRTVMDEVEVIRRAVDRRVRRHRRDDDAVGTGEIAQAVRREHRLACATAWGARSEGRRVGTGGLMTCRSRWWTEYE